MIMFREHRGGYTDSMRTVKHIDATMPALLRLLATTHMAELAPLRPSDKVVVEKYGDGVDTRNQWDTHLVLVNDKPWGFCSGLIEWSSSDVPKGTYINNKNCNSYVVTGVVRNATNDHDGQLMVLYHKMGTSHEQHVRDIGEFLRKFRVSGN